MSNFIDMTGWTMKEHGVQNSKWTVIRYIGFSKWLCQCDCGSIKEVAGTTLRKGTSLSCGKCREKAPNLINEIGHRYGRLVVMGSAGLSNDKHKKWICQCDCGKQIIAIGKNLRSGSTTSCGCYREERRRLYNQLDITNKKFGKLTAIKPIKIDDNNQFVWECKCDCGNITYKTVHSLTTGNVKSCGCIKSYGETKIEKLLIELNINFKREHSFNELLGVGEGRLRFDFALFNQEKLIGLIEYQGNQHTDKNNPWWTPTLQQHDQMKINYCKENNIPLIIINYDELNTLTTERLKDKINEYCY